MALSPEYAQGKELVLSRRVAIGAGVAGLLAGLGAVGYAASGCLPLSDSGTNGKQKQALGRRELLGSIRKPIAYVCERLEEEKQNIKGVIVYDCNKIDPSEMPVLPQQTVNKPNL